MLMILQFAAACGFLALAVCILARPHFAQSALATFPLGRRARVAFAAISLIPSLALGLSIFVPFVAFFAAAFAGLTALAFGLLATFRDGVRSWPVTASLFLLSAFIGLLQPLGLKVLLLPKADKFPYEPVPAHVVKTYGPGVGFESVRAGKDGTLYLAANVGLDFTGQDYYRNAHGEVIVRRVDGSELTLFKTPTGSTGGVMAISPDGTLFMSSNGATPGIWRITKDGQGTLFAPLPAGAWPNGLDFGPDGNLYSPDSSLGLVWRIDPQTGQAQTALKSPSLLARRYVALAPGANGLHFRGPEMIVTVSDSTKILSFTMDGLGKFGPEKELATGIPGDDFAIGPDGSLFVTTHPYNTLVKVAPDGRRSIIADARDRIVGATDAVFGTTPQDQNTLYVATDGGAFTDGPGASGQLIALRPYK